MKRILNVIKDIFDPRDHVAPPNVAAAAVKVSFRAQVPYIKDQGQEGSCTAHAGTEMMELLYRTKPSQLAKHIDVTTLRFSPGYLYAMERIMDGTFPSDSGSESRTIMRALATVGACLESEDPYGLQNATTRPTADQNNEAALYKIGAYHRIPDVETAKSVLVSGYSFCIGIPLFQDFESDETAETGLVKMPSGSIIGGHELHVIGADDSKQVYGETGAFEVQNSWSPSWGDAGFCWIPYAYLTKVWDESDSWLAHFGGIWKA